MKKEDTQAILDNMIQLLNTIIEDNETITPASDDTNRREYLEREQERDTALANKRNKRLVKYKQKEKTNGSK